MTVIEALRQIPVEEGSSTLLRVYQDDLTVEDQRSLTGYPHPYAIVHLAAEGRHMTALSASPIIETILDITLELLPVDGQRPRRSRLTEIRNAVLHVMHHDVTELEKGESLLSLGGTYMAFQTATPIGASYQNSTRLATTLRYLCRMATEL